MTRKLASPTNIDLTRNKADGSLKKEDLQVTPKIYHSLGRGSLSWFITQKMMNNESYSSKCRLTTNQGVSVQYTIARATVHACRATPCVGVRHQNHHPPTRHLALLRLVGVSPSLFSFGSSKRVHSTNCMQGELLRIKYLHVGQVRSLFYCLDISGQVGS